MSDSEAELLIHDVEEVDNYNDFSLFQEFVEEENLDNHYVYCNHSGCQKYINGHCTVEECIELDYIKNDFSVLEADIDPILDDLED